MASSGMLADFARRPAGFKVAVFVGIGIALGGLYYQFVFSPLRSDVQAAKDQRDGLARQEDQVRKDEREHAELSKRRTELQRTINENENALPTASQLPAFFDMLNQRVGEAGVEVRLWKYEKEVPVEEFFKVPVEIEIQGSFYQVKKFFYLLYKMSQKEGAEPGVPAPGAPGAPAGIEERDRILTIEDLRLYDPVVVNNELRITARFRASTFRKDAPLADVLDDKKPAKPGAKPGAKDDPKAAPAGGAKGAAAAPGGAVGEAKERTEDAMDTSEKRVEKAPDGADRVKGGM